MPRKRPTHPPASRDAASVAPRASGPLQVGELVQLTDPRGTKKTITTEAGATLHTHRGQLAHDAIIGAAEGSTVVSDRGIEFLIQRPALEDYVLGMPRGAAVIYPKDAARIISLADIGYGTSVVEAGAGSGALTCYLLRTCGPEGQVTSIERRSDFAEIASENVCRWFGGMPDSWSLVEGDLAELPGVGTAPELTARDAVVLDMLAPWECLDAAYGILRPGGALVVYVATTTQLSRVVETMRASRRWVEPRAEESIVRTWHLDGLAVRPDHRMSGHTGFLVASRRMAEGQSAPERKRRPAPGAYGEDYRGPGAAQVADPEPG